jgi:uncharacterized cupin superfamily protein
LVTILALHVTMAVAADPIVNVRDALGSAAPTRVDPIAFDMALHSASGFTRLPPWPREMLIKGGGADAARRLFSGELTVELYDAGNETVELVDQPYDEFVYVVRGEVVITAKGGSPRRYRHGEFFVCPKGFTGRWQTLHRYRELIAIETNAYNRGTAAYFPTEKKP